MSEKEFVNIQTSNNINSINKLTNANEKNKRFIINFNIFLLIISTILAIFGAIDYYNHWSEHHHELFILFYGMNWAILTLNLVFMYSVNIRKKTFLNE